MKGLLIDQSPLDARGGVAGLAVHGNASYGGFAMMRSYNDSHNSCSSMSSLNHLFLDLGTGVFGSYGSRSPPPPFYSSLSPSFSFARARAMVSSPSPLPLLQPPLLPLPSPLPSKKINTTKITNKISNVRLRDQRKKRKPAASSTLITTRVCQPNHEPKKPIQRASAMSERDDHCEEEEEKESVFESLYSFSPPPSSLPLPSFSLTRLKTAATSCITAKAMPHGGGCGDSGGGGAMQNGATDELRRLLRL